MTKKILVFVSSIFLAVSVYAQKAQRIAYIDMEYILESVPDYNEAESQLDGKVKKWKEKIDKKQYEVAEMKIDLSNEKALLTAGLIEEREEDIAIKEEELRALQIKYFGPEGSLYKLRKQLVKPVQDQVYNSIQEIAKKRKYDFVLDKSSDLIMLYTNDKYDISDMVIKSITRDEKQKAVAEKRESRKKKNAAKQKKAKEPNPELEEKAKARAEKKKALQERIAAQKAARKKQREEKKEEMRLAREKKLAERAAAKKKAADKKAGIIVEEEQVEDENKNQEPAATNGEVSNKNATDKAPEAVELDENINKEEKEVEKTKEELNKEADDEKKAAQDSKAELKKRIAEKKKASAERRAAQKKQIEEKRRKRIEEREAKKKELEEKRAANKPNGTDNGGEVVPNEEPEQE